MKKRYTPETFNIVSSADEIGALVDIQRISGEDLDSYKKRVLESSKKPSNSTYEGLINAINRDLGLERKLAFSIDLRDLFYAKQGEDLTVSGDTIIDNRSFSGTIDSVNTVCVGNKLTTNQEEWIPGELVGLSFFVAGEEFLIESNSENEFIFNGDLSGLVNQSFSIAPNWEDNIFAGMSLVTNKNKFNIIANSEKIIKIDGQLEESSEFRIQATSPRVFVNSAKIVLYKDYINDQNFQLEKEIDIRARGKNHTSIVDEINKSKFFIAKNLLRYNEQLPAFTIKKQDSDKRVKEEQVPSSKFFRLKNANVKDGSLRFSQANVFFNETRDLSQAPFGPYYSVNYKEGVVQAKKVGTSSNNIVSYTYMDFPFMVEACPAVITAFADKSSGDFLFTQEEKRLYNDPRDKKMPIQPRSDMIEYIAKLLKTSRQTWGE